MLVVRVNFELAETDVESLRQSRRRIDEWILAAQNNGQLMGQEIPAYQDDTSLCYTVLLPEETALVAPNADRWLEETFGGLREQNIAPPVLTLLGRDLDTEEVCACLSRKSLILITNYITLQSPLRCGDCFAPVPLYHIPVIRDGDKYSLLAWEADYQACDTLQMNCATGERFAIHQMSSPDSSLTRRGRAICADIGLKTGLPVYYYLYRYRGRTLDREKQKGCPICGGEWLLPRPLFGRFHFRCDTCYLLSNIAYHLLRK